MKWSIELAERAWLPDWAIRLGIRGLLKNRLRETNGRSLDATDFSSGPIAVHTDDANAQHYEVPPAFYRYVLGPRLKYSCCYYSAVDHSLADAEETMLALTCERAGLEDGMDILEVGCGWGSLTLWMAEHYPNARITAMSNSTGQRAHIESEARDRGLRNVEIVTADINDFVPGETFDRIVSVEMFEHVRNYNALLGKVRRWLKPDGALFVHVFCHRDTAYRFEADGDGNWMARHFFSGGTMPSYDLLPAFENRVVTDQRWVVPGTHYARTCRAWLSNLDAHRIEILKLFQKDLSPTDAAVQLQRWRMFFMACEELFAYDGGFEWHVAHYRFHPAATGAERNATLAALTGGS